MTLIPVARKFFAEQFDPDKTWPADVSETFGDMPPAPSTRELREMSRHQLLHAGRQREADAKVVALHAQGFTHYYWDGIEAHGLRAGFWIVRAFPDSNLGIKFYSDEVFRVLFMEIL